MRKNSKFKFKRKKYTENIQRTNIKQILEISFYK